MATGKYSKYAILNRTTKLRLHCSPDIPRDTVAGGGKANNDDEISVPAGNLIKVFQTKAPQANVGLKNYSTVQVLDMVSRLHIYENLFECPQSNLLRVDEGLWPYVISIVEPETRLRLVQDTKHCNWFTCLKANDFVSVSGEMFGNTSQRFDCIIRYIGPVNEMHPVGYFFGLELLVGNCIVYDIWH